VLVLSASSRGADRIGLEMEVNSGTEHIVWVDSAASSCLGGGSVSKAIFDVLVWSEVGNKVVAWVVLRSSRLSLPNMSKL
jgi:hypothetical protein